MRKQKFTRPITIYVTEQVFREIKTITDRDEISIGEWIRYAINNTLTTDERGDQIP